MTYQYLYDSNGRMIDHPEDVGAILTVYNANGRMIGRLEPFGVSLYICDMHGTIGELQKSGSTQYLYDGRGATLGKFDGYSTYDADGQKIGEGNLLFSLLQWSD